MPRPRKLSVGGINVRIVKPELRDYGALFQAIFACRMPVRVRGNDYLILTNFDSWESDRLNFGGSIGRFTDIPKDAEWLDTQRLAPANNKKKSEIIIPFDLKPNYESFFCGLFDGQHVFAFETYSSSKALSPHHVVKWLREVCDSEYITKKFGEIEIDALPDYQLVENILSSEKINEIEIIIKRTNPDDYTAEQFKKSEEKLKSLNAVEENLTYKAGGGNYLTLDNEVKSLGRVGAENGSLNARVQDGGVAKRLSTSRHPLEVQEVYDPDVTPPMMMFRSLAQRLIGVVIGNREG